MYFKSLMNSLSLKTNTHRNTNLISFLLYSKKSKDLYNLNMMFFASSQDITIDTDKNVSTNMKNSMF
jgi:hypothetical protein